MNSVLMHYNIISYSSERISSVMMDDRHSRSLRGIPVSCCSLTVTFLQLASERYAAHATTAHAR